MQDKPFRLRLLGPLVLCHQTDGVLAISSAKAQGLLALLASTNGRPVERPWLQDKLWSDRGPLHGRNSLKQEIRALRRLFEPYFDDVLITSGGPIRLNTDRVSVDVFEPFASEASNNLLQPEFLEGLDIKDNEFNRWLCEARDTLRNVRPGNEDTKPRNHLKLAISPVIAVETDMAAKQFGDMVLNRLLTSLRSLGVFELFDYRYSEDGKARGPDVTLQLRAMSMAGAISLSFTASRVDDSKMIWSQDRWFETDTRTALGLDSFVAGLTDHLTFELFSTPALRETEQLIAARSAMEGIDRMFRLEKPDLRQVAASLNTAIDIEPAGIYFAWYAFLMVFRLEASKGGNLGELRDHADSLAAQALEADPHNPLVRSLLTHVYSFLFRDFHRADELISPLASAPPPNPIYYDCLGKLRFYTGDHAAARKAASVAVEMGQHNPYRYAFLTGRLMVDVMEGDFASAITLGEKMIAQQHSSTRKYEPGLRYLSTAYARSGDLKNASRVFDIIRGQTPNFAPESLDEERFPIPSEPARRFLRASFHEIEQFRAS